MVSTHAALVVTAPGQVHVERISTKRPRSRELLVSPLCVGVCGTDLDMIRGTRPVGTTILGHEGVAEVVAVGPGTTNFSVGQHVTFLPMNPNNPEEALGQSIEGLYQQYFLISQAALERGLVVPFDPRLPLVCGPLIEPLATVIYGQSLVSQVSQQQSIAIMGAGPIGLLNALYARAGGCSRVFLIGTSQERLDWAVKRGIVQSSHAFLNSPQLVDILLERTAGQGVDVAYLCTPRSATRSVLRQALHFLSVEGCIDLVAGTSTTDELLELPGVNLDRIKRANVCGLGRTVNQYITETGKKLWLTGHSGTSREYLQEAMKHLLKEPAGYARIISHIVSCSAAPLVFEQLLAVEPQRVQGEILAKVVIDFTIEGQVVEVFEPHYAE